MALMGPSGCGKTTLLNNLARRAASFASTGGICSVNGAEVDDQVFRRMISYVEQEDSLIGSLTVEETLAFAAKLSLPKYYSPYYFLDQSKTNISFIVQFLKKSKRIASGL